ncbi:MAG: AAA family ATPase [Thermoguttaceae bacterium]|nr:AAA family ATPase [Thermoguttaceae bacterium]MDW8079161.1 AAA family ATPase [Thermoguttaceae bacterium]
MDPIDIVDILQVLTQILRAGAEYVVGFIAGLVVAGSVTLGIWRLVSRRTHKILQELQTELNTERRNRTYIQELCDKTKAEVADLLQKLALLNRELEEARQQEVKLQEQLAHTELKLHTEAEAHEQLEAKLRQLEQKYAAEQQAWQEEGERLNSECNQLKSILEEKQREIDQLRCERAELLKSAESLQAQLDNAFKNLSEAWHRPSSHLIPDFLLLTERRCPIIAFVNLKGGVGKTTISAYLGAALAEKGKRVLLVDLDYQSSLTQLCLPPERRPWSYQGPASHPKSWSWVGRFLEDPEGNLDVALCQAHRVPARHDWRLYIWPSHERLDEVETQLFVELFFSPPTQETIDQRFRLRRVLHQREINQWFDIVLLDCPPRLTAGCVNALMAADCYLVPVRPDATSGDAVPRLIRWVDKFQELRRDHPLELLGIVFNEASKRANSPGGVIRDHGEMIEEIGRRAEAAAKRKIYRFQTFVKADSDFARASKGGGLAWPNLRNSRIWPVFHDLASEVLRRLKELGDALHEGA